MNKKDFVFWCLVNLLGGIFYFIRMAWELKDITSFDFSVFDYILFSFVYSLMTGFFSIPLLFNSRILSLLFKKSTLLNRNILIILLFASGLIICIPLLNMGFIEISRITISIVPSGVILLNFIYKNEKSNQPAP
jgi:hypothetical protein